jgi:hypothetical protein
LLVPLCIIPDDERASIPCDCENDEACMRRMVAKYCKPAFQRWGTEAQHKAIVVIKYLLNCLDDTALGIVVKPLFDQPYMAFSCPDNPRAFCRWVLAELIGENSDMSLDCYQCILEHTRANLLQ